MSKKLYGDSDMGHVKNSHTSEEAAESIDESTLGRLESEVFAMIRRSPSTCDKLERALGLSHQTTSARIRGLFLRGFIRDSGRKALTRSKRRAIVWEIAR